MCACWKENGVSRRSLPFSHERNRNTNAMFLVSLLALYWINEQVGTIVFKTLWTPGEEGLGFILVPEAEDDDRHRQSWKAVVLFWEAETAQMEGLKQPLHGLVHKHTHSLSASLQCSVSAEGNYNLISRYFERHAVFTGRTVLSLSAQFLKYVYILVFILNQKGYNFEICDLSSFFSENPIALQYMLHTWEQYCSFLMLSLCCDVFYLIFICGVHYYWNSWSCIVQCYIVPLEYGL